MEQDLVVGEPAARWLNSGRRLGDAHQPERGIGALVLIFHLQDTTPTARLIYRAVRIRYSFTSGVLIASIIDLSIEPPVETVLAMLATSCDIP